MFPYNSFRPLPTMDRRWRPNVEELASKCPRCDSSNTKFCYYNNYCLTQPRYFCKGCRRYWTKGGSLRNIPIGGGCRKSRRGKSAKLNSTASSSSSSSSANTGAEPQNSFRPDHALESMAGSFPSPESIDLAQLYAKFLNQCPELENQEAMPIEPRLMMIPCEGSLERQSSSAEIAAEAVSRNYVEKKLTGGEENKYLHEEQIIEHDQFIQFQGRGSQVTDYYLLDSSYPLVTDQMWQNSRFQGLGISVMEDSTVLSQQNLVGGDWGMFDLPSLEAFL